MISEGHVVLFKFPSTSQTAGKLRPALVLKRLPGKYNDWLICMISSQLHQFIKNIDEQITPNDPDFQKSGLKQPSLIRVSRLAVVDQSILAGKLGHVDTERLNNLKMKLCNWIKGA
jgi:mRNA interferase MazF